MNFFVFYSQNALLINLLLTNLLITSGEKIKLHFLENHEGDATAAFFKLLQKSDSGA